MSPVVPPQVKDREKRTKIFDWRVPLEVGSRRAFAAGELFWVPSGSKTPTAAIVSLVVIVALALAVVYLVRRRRGGHRPPVGDLPGDGGEHASGGKEAW
jgi:hypothetical protein